MKRKRPRRRNVKPPPARGGAAGRRAVLATPVETLQYKVVELSTVDEGALEYAVNEWVRKGWRLENVQFAMRESSKRPAMAFVFFTRPGEAASALHDPEEARQKLVRLAEAPTELRSVSAAPFPVSAHDRLRQLAGEDDESAEEGLTLDPDEDPESRT